jgi:hypothetical protein
VLVAENEPQDTRLIEPGREGGYGLDGCGTTTSITARWWR